MHLFQLPSSLVEAYSNTTLHACTQAFTVKKCSSSAMSLTCLLISCFLSHRLLRLYANYYGNQSCGYDYQLSMTSFMLIILFVTISSNLEQVTLACEQTCYTSSTEGAAYGIIAVSCSTFVCQNS